MAQSSEKNSLTVKYGVSKKMLHYKNTTKAKFATIIRWNLLIMI